MTGTAATVAWAAARYFAILFAFGFAFGTLRVLVLAPAFGPVIAVLIELPLMLWLSWRIGAAIVRGRRPLDGPLPRLQMGALAFAMLIAAEFLLGTLVFGQSPADWFAALGSRAGMIGLAGQFLFGTIPAVQWFTKTGR